ncbi:MAG: FAD-binding protein [Desulfobacteraceae bacterium]|jgi:succinate dehydrogenase/fumarate reductase flavoprotein subunit
MQFKESHTVSCDVLVIGGGGGGLRAAIEARERGADVLVVSKSRVGYGNNTYVSKAAFSATGWGDPEDGPQVHLKDTVIGGRFLNDQNLVALMAEQAGSQVPFLEKCGVIFWKKEGKVRVAKAAGHSFARHVHAARRVGSELILPLKAYAKRIGVRFGDRVFVTKLLSSGDRIAGAFGVTENGVFQVFAAQCVILATGGFANVYLHTNNAPGITGDGQALAYELGLPIKDMEFVQFYPTATGKLGRSILLYEVFVLGAGAKLKNAKGEDIIEKHGLSDPMVLTRDRLARAIMGEIAKGLDVEGGVIMDLNPIPEGKIARLGPLFPSKRSVDRKAFIVSPTTHFCMGGVIMDKNTETSVPGLFAVGEVGAGIHGANRLAGNALCEVFTMGHIAGKGAAQRFGEMRTPKLPRDEISAEKARLESLFTRGRQDPKTLSRLLKEVMWQKAGIVRYRGSLEEMLQRIEAFRSPDSRFQVTTWTQLIRYLEFQNMLLISEMICRAALLRTESRGSHYRSDYPEEDNSNWLKNIVLRKEEGGMRLEAVPVSLDVLGPE